MTDLSPQQLAIWLLQALFCEFLWKSYDCSMSPHLMISFQNLFILTKCMFWLSYVFLFCVMLAFLLKSVISSHSSCAILLEIPTPGNSKWAIPEKTQTGGLRIYFFENPLQRFIFLLYHSCLSHLNLEMEAECLTKTLSYMNVNISKAKNGRNKL